MDKSTRNLVIFIIVVLACGWVGAWINHIIPSPSPEQSLGLLLWLMAPLIAVLFLRGPGKDGWKDFGLGLPLKGNLGWYTLSLLIYPLAVLITLGLGSVFSGISFEGLIERGSPALWTALGVAFASSLIKNVFEEFSWRGYLTPRFAAVGLGRWLNHLLTGLIWGLWHVPYWLYFNTAETYASFTYLNVGWFMVLGLLGIFPTAVVYGELRLKTGSLWPAFLAHNVINAITATFLIDGLIKPTGVIADLWFSPAPGGLVMMVVFWLVGLWMLLKRSQ